MFIYSTNINEIQSDSRFLRLAEIKSELDTLPEIDYRLKYLSDVCIDSLNVEWESEYGCHWVSYDTIEALEADIDENSAINVKYEAQIELEEELNTFNLRLLDEIYYKY